MSTPKTKIIPDIINVGGGFPAIYPDLKPEPLIKYIEEIKDVHANPIQIYIRGKLTTLKPKVDATQFDGAFLKKGTGKGGMICS